MVDIKAIQERVARRTPGKWIAKVHQSGEGFGIYAETRSGEFGEHSLASANLYEHYAYSGFFNKEETEANAELIAAAPDLLSALSEYKGLIREMAKALWNLRKCSAVRVSGSCGQCEGDAEKLLSDPRLLAIVKEEE